MRLQHLTTTDIETICRIAELALLCWLGRGDASIELLRPHAEHTYSPTLPYYLADKPLLGEYLRTGINKLNSKLS